MNADKLRKAVGKCIRYLRQVVSAAGHAGTFLRKNAFTETGAVSVFLILFSACTLFLDAKIDRDLDPDVAKDWWTLSFETRNPDSLAFSIENHSDGKDFSYTVTDGGTTLDSGNVRIGKGDRLTVSPDEGGGGGPGRTTIIVKDAGGMEKSVYRER